MAVEASKKKTGEWGQSTFSKTDLNNLKQRGLLEGMEAQIPEKANVDFVGPPMPFKKGMKPAEMQAE